MLEFIPSREDVIATRMSGKLTSEEMEQYVNRLEQSLERHPKTHLYVEITDFRGMEMKNLGNLTRRSFALLNRLDRFGRIAVVADRAWLRWLAKLESALLPKVSYRTFKPEERESALAYVEGGTPLPRSFSLTVIETDRPTVWGFEIDGYLTEGDIAAATEYFEDLLERDLPLRMLSRIRNLDGFAFGGLMDDDFFEMKLGMLRRIQRYAVVGGPHWVEKWVATLDRLLPSIEIRHFPLESEAAAWLWLEAEPRRERPLRPEF